MGIDLKEQIRFWSRDEEHAVRIMTFGASESHFADHSHARPNWYQWLEKTLRCNAGAHFIMMNAAVNGNCVRDLAKRFERDVLPLKPDLVFMTMGANDANTDMSVEEFKETLTMLCRRIIEWGGIPVLQTLYCPVMSGFGQEYARVWDFMEANREITRELDIPLIDTLAYFKPYYDNAPEKYAADIMTDNIHVSELGNAVWACFAAEQLGLPLPSLDDMTEAVMQQRAIIGGYLKKGGDGFETRAAELVARMTLEEKTSQLTYRSPAIPRLGIPAYNWWNEALHGVARAGTATSFPQCIGMAAAFDSGMVQEVADVISTEGRAKYNESVRKGDRDIYKGLTFWCPNINIFRDPRWGRGHETFGEDPYLTSRLGVSYVRGLQGNGKYLKTAACAKHFAVHSGPEQGRHEFNSVVSKKDLWETYLKAFEACVKEAGVEGIMGAYNRLNGEACCASKGLLTDILRGQWGFSGYVVSDCGAIADIHEHHHITAGAEESAALALSSGCDLNCGSIYLYVLKAVKDGLIEEKAVDQAVGHLLATRLRLGLFEETEYDSIPFEVVECKKHLSLARQVARRTMVLLKNDGILPLAKEKLHSIAVIGPNADSIAALKANYNGTSSRYMTMLAGIQEAVGDEVRVYYAEGSHLYRETSEGGAAAGDRVKEAVSAAERSDVVVMCLGLDASIEGEEGDASNEYAAGDKKTLSLPKCQLRLFEEVAKTGRPIVLCILSGSALDLSFAEEHAGAILQVWYPGAEGGAAAADLIFGKESPSAKLPVTFYRSVEDLPPFGDYAMEGRTYRYFKGKPLYPFGYGLNYGDMRCTAAGIDRRADGSYYVTAKIRNAGAADTRDVLQVYVKNTTSEYAPENSCLCAMQPVFLKAGEEKEVTVRVREEELYITDEDGKRRKDGESYVFHVGFQQPDARSEELTGKKTIEIG